MIDQVKADLFIGSNKKCHRMANSFSVDAIKYKDVAVASFFENNLMGSQLIIRLQILLHLFKKHKGMILWAQNEVIRF